MSMNSEEKQKALMGFVNFINCVAREAAGGTPTMTSEEQQGALMNFLTFIKEIGREAGEDAIQKYINDLGNKPNRKSSRKDNRDRRDPALVKFYNNVIAKVNNYAEKFGEEFTQYLNGLDAYPLKTYTENQLRRTLALIHRWDEQHPSAEATTGAEESTEKSAGVGSGEQEEETPF